MLYIILLILIYWRMLVPLPKSKSVHVSILTVCLGVNCFIFSPISNYSVLFSNMILRGDMSIGWHVYPYGMHKAIGYFLNCMHSFLLKKQQSLFKFIHLFIILTILKTVLNLCNETISPIYIHFSIHIHDSVFESWNYFNYF